MKDIWDLVGINPTQKNLNPSYWGERSDYNNVIAIYPITPILRPMDLTKPIIVEGKEIIPGVELAKIEGFYNYANGYIAVDKELSTGVTDGVTSFYYSFKHKCFILRHCDGVYTIRNQYALFQWLFKHKFDVFGLIEKGLAIDVNTLQTNPYE